MGLPVPVRNPPARNLHQSSLPPTSTASMVFDLTEKQGRFVGAEEQFCASVGAIGTGKSTSLICKAMFHSQEDAGNLGVIVRKNFTDLRDSTIKDFEDYTGMRVSENKKECVLPNKSIILFRHGDELPVLKNLNLGFFGIEQAEEFGDETTWQFLKMRLRRKCKHRNGFIVANTAGHNWIWQIWKKNGPPKNHLLVETKTEEHAHILPPDYLENLKTLPSKLYRRYVENSWDVTEGLVYDEFDVAKHVVEPFDIPPTWERGFVLDHGFRNPTAVLWYAIDYDGTIFLYDEHYQTEKPISFHADAIKTRGIYSGIADPSIFSKTQSRAGSGDIFSIADEYGDAGVSLSPALREEERGRIARVNEFFKQGKIKVFKTMNNWLHEASSWKWKEVSPSRANLNLPEVPDDKNNHQMDNTGYLIATRFQPSVAPVARKSIYLPPIEEDEEVAANG